MRTHPTSTPAPLADLLVLEAVKRGPRALLELLYELALHVFRAAGHRVIPSQLTFHLPQELLARAQEVHLVTLWRHLKVLKALGVVDTRRHYTTTDRGTRIDGTLFAVSLKPGHRARVRYEDMKHRWRDLDADRAAGNTAWAVLQGSTPVTKTEWKLLLKRWAVNPGKTFLPLESDPCNSTVSLQALAERLPDLAGEHPTRRAALVRQLGGEIAQALNDQHSRRYWYKRLWGALEAENEGRPGFGELALQLRRMHADLRERAPWRKAGAVLVSRLSA